MKVTDMKTAGYAERILHEETERTEILITQSLKPHKLEGRAPASSILTGCLGLAGARPSNL